MLTMVIGMALGVLFTCVLIIVVHLNHDTKSRNRNKQTFVGNCEIIYNGQFSEAEPPLAPTYGKRFVNMSELGETGIPRQQEDGDQTVLLVTIH